MKSYNRLTQEEGYYIFVLKANKVSIRQIAKQLNHSHSSISREISCNSEKGRYSPRKAQNKALTRRQSIGPPFKIQGELVKKIKIFDPRNFRIQSLLFLILVQNNRPFEYFYF